MGQTARCRYGAVQMTDHELLELAAKAAGIEIHESDDGTLQKRPIWAVTHFVCGQPYGESQWNPLNDDGAALRLAVKLGLRVCSAANNGEHSVASATRDYIAAHAEKNGIDPYAATRRAIVRAAAEIGKGMQ